MHKLSSIDFTKRTANCDECGLVKITSRGRKKNKQIFACGNYYGSSKDKKIKRMFLNMTKPNLCEICNKKTELVRDHCHIDNIARGWICHSCNKGLGFFEDNIKILQNAISYLKKERKT